MSEKLVKRQHFVPRTYLKHFGILKGKDYIISVLPKGKFSEKSIFETNIKKIALEKNLYTLPGKTIEEKMLLEKFYSNELEHHYDKVFKILTNDKKIEVSYEERKLIISTVITMYFRTTKWLNIKRDLMRRVFEGTFSLCKQSGKDHFFFEGIKISIAGKTLDDFTKEYNKKMQPAMVLTQLKTALKLINLRLENSGIYVVKIENKEIGFFTSDNPVIASNNKENFAPFDPTNILKLPLNSKYLLFIMPESIKGKENMIIRRNSKSTFGIIDCLLTNYFQVENSDKYIFGSRNNIISYLTKKEKLEEILIQYNTSDFNNIGKIFDAFNKLE